MATQWMDDIKEALAEGSLDIFNTKEDAEVLKGLFLGRYAHQQFIDAHTIKQAKMFDML